MEKIIHAAVMAENGWIFIGKLICFFGFHKWVLNPFQHHFNPDWGYDSEYGCITRGKTCAHCGLHELVYMQNWYTFDFGYVHVDQVYPQIVEACEKMNREIENA